MAENQSVGNHRFSGNTVGGTRMMLAEQATVYVIDDDESVRHA